MAVLLWALLCGTAPAQQARSGSLILDITNIAHSGGTIWVGLYDSKDSYLVKEKATIKGIEVRKRGKVRLEIPNLPFGYYAVGIFHDVNNNGDMDRNYVGVPTEPFAFSKTPASKWRVPRYDEIKIYFSKDNQTLNMQLKTWWD